VNGGTESGELLEHLFRHQSGRIVAHLARLLGPAQLDLAEESVQDAMVRALQTWPHQGVPENPPAWLFRVAQNAALDTVRRRQLAGRKTAEIAAELERPSFGAPGDPQFEEQLRDDELRMIFMCCHSELSRESRVALSLKTVSGFSVREIARAFLSDEAAIAQRLVRAKRQIRDRALTLDLPSRAELGARLDSVLDVIYFLFNEGYAAHEGEDLIRRELCFEALRLASLIAGSSIATPRAHALVACIALQAARFDARVDESGDLVRLEDQDRSRWDPKLIAAGFHHFDKAMTGEEVSEYHVQAAIAATHARPDPPEVLWPIILQLYDQLLAINASPVVALNRAVAVSKVLGAEPALAAIGPLVQNTELREYHLLLATRGLFLMELGRNAEAARDLREALECRCSEPERRFLQKKLVECAMPAQLKDLY
jgi:RNA polymerase sigma-70 factor (ECF subfamily)